MKFTEAKSQIEQILNEEARAFNIKELTVTTVITYQDSNGDECDSESKALRFMSGELFIKHDKLPDDHILGFSMVVECKLGGNVDELALKGEIEEFKDQLEKLRTELAQSKSIPEFIYALTVIAEAENQKLTAELSEQVAKIDKNVKIMTYSAIAVAIIGIVLVVLLNI